MVGIRKAKYLTMESFLHDAGIKKTDSFFHFPFLFDRLELLMSIPARRVYLFNRVYRDNIAMWNHEEPLYFESIGYEKIHKSDCGNLYFTLNGNRYDFSDSQAMMFNRTFKA